MQPLSVALDAENAGATDAAPVRVELSRLIERAWLAGCLAGDRCADGRGDYHLRMYS